MGPYCKVLQKNVFYVYKYHIFFIYCIEKYHLFYSFNLLFWPSFIFFKSNGIFKYYIFIFSNYCDEFFLYCSAVIKCEGKIVHKCHENVTMENN